MSVAEGSTGAAPGAPGGPPPGQGEPAPAGGQAVRLLNRPLRVSFPRTRNFGVAMFLVRLFGALFLVFSTYNPSGWSLWHWYERDWPADWLLLMPVTVAYLVVYVLLWSAAYRALRPTGVALTTALLGSLAWVLIDAGIVPLDTAGDLVVVVLYMTGGLLGIGVTWAAAWVTLTGQVITDDLTA